MEMFKRYTRTYFAAELELGIGLHFARMIVGQLGHPAKLEVSALGDANQVVEQVQVRQPAGGPCILATEELVFVSVSAG